MDEDLKPKTNVPPIPFTDIWVLIPEEIRTFILERKKRFDGGAIGAIRAGEKPIVRCMSEDLQDLFALTSATKLALSQLVEGKESWVGDDYETFCILDLYHDLVKPFTWFAVRKRYGLTRDYKGIGIRNGFQLVCIDTEESSDSLNNLLKLIKKTLEG